MKRNRSEYFKKYRRERPEIGRSDSDRFRLLKRGAKERGLDMTLSKEDMLEMNSLPCSYCGGSCASHYGHGIDRKNSSIGYVHGNVVPCCKTCNIAKNSMSIEEFKSWISRAFHYINNE